MRDFVFEPLVVFNAMHNGSPNYRLATEYSYVGNLLKLTFKLRDGVQWSDGATLQRPRRRLPLRNAEEAPAARHARHLEPDHCGRCARRRYRRVHAEAGQHQHRL
ncbi:MAG: hypothetical protein WDN69_10885 [Aliidongia sp.]